MPHQNRHPVNSPEKEGCKNRNKSSPINRAQWESKKSVKVARADPVEISHKKGGGFRYITPATRTKDDEGACSYVPRHIHGQAGGGICMRACRAFCCCLARYLRINFLPAAAPHTFGLVTDLTAFSVIGSEIKTGFFCFSYNYAASNEVTFEFEREKKKGGGCERLACVNPENSLES